MRALILVVLAVGCGRENALSSRSPQTAPTTARPANVQGSERHADQAGEHLQITGIDPAQGDAGGGTYVRIKGRRFTVDGPRTAKVYFGGREAAVDRFVSDGDLMVEAPGGDPGEIVDVVVVLEPGGRITIPRAFTFVAKR
jgi:hypothetical protein